MSFVPTTLWISREEMMLEIPKKPVEVIKIEPTFVVGIQKTVYIKND